jgi:hypothetical protein
MGLRRRKRQRGRAQRRLVPTRFPQTPLEAGCIRCHGVGRGWPTSGASLCRPRKSLDIGWGRRFRPMPHSFEGRLTLYKWWGGPPGPRLTPPSACRTLQDADVVVRKAGRGRPSRAGVPAPPIPQNPHPSKPCGIQRFRLPTGICIRHLTLWFRRCRAAS